MNFRDKIEEKIFEWVLAALGSVLAVLGSVLAAFACYLIRCKSKVDNLKTQVEELRGARNRLQHDVNTAISNLMTIYDDVKGRLTKSDDIIAEAGIILEDYNKGWWLYIISRYQVSKRADKAASEAKNLKDEISTINSDRVGYHESTQVVETVTSNKGYEAFESRKPTITGVLEALKDPNIARIGIHGMGGVGKTMLVKEVLKQAEKGKLFDKYLFLVVSNDPDLKKIQTEISKQLDLKLEEEGEVVRRDQLRKRLQQENRVLIILDDIWKDLDLEALGIFFGDDQKGCKLLLTSRLQSILRDFMDTQMQFPVGVLSDNEAISLFEKIVGDLAKTGEFKSNMHQIVKECAGLPIAITTVANALKNKENIYVWKDALNKLKMSCPIKIEGMDEEVYKSIKLSYDFLESEAKSLLSLCSLHREDYNIKVEDLLKYGVGLDLFHNIHKIEDARCRVHTLVDRLKDSCFLLDGYYNGTVKMHDVIRDVVIYIAAEEKRMFTIRTAIELQNLSKREDAVAISLPYINDDLELPNQFECSKLELLLLSYQEIDQFVVHQEIECVIHHEIDFPIPDSFFEGLKNLKVLKLSRSWPEFLPSSLASLENLQTLCLSGVVQNVITIGELKNVFRHCMHME